MVIYIEIRTSLRRPRVAQIGIAVFQNSHFPSGIIKWQWSSLAVDQKWQRYTSVLEANSHLRPLKYTTSYLLFTPFSKPPQCKPRHPLLHRTTYSASLPSGPSSHQRTFSLCPSVTCRSHPYRQFQAVGNWCSPMLLVKHILKPFYIYLLSNLHRSGTLTTMWTTGCL